MVKHSKWVWIFAIDFYGVLGLDDSSLPANPLWPVDPRAEYSNTPLPKKGASNET